MKRLLILSIALLVPMEVMAQTEQSSDTGRAVYSAVGIEAGYFKSYGTWQKHRYAPVNQFKGNLVIGPLYEIIMKNVTLSFFYNYIRLSVQEWVSYARNRGDIVSATAHSKEFGLAFKYHVIHSMPHIADIQLGMSYLYLSGRESYGGADYTYDFLSTSDIGLFCGAGYGNYLNKHLMLYIDGKYLWSPARI